MKSQSKSQGKSFVISLVSLIFILGLVILSDTAPSLRFESQTLQQAPQDSLSQIKGKADCSCGSAACKNSTEIAELVQSTCQFGVGGCSGCKGSTVIEVKYGNRKGCLAGKDFADPGGCCEDECKELNCEKTKCPVKKFKPTKAMCSEEPNEVSCKNVDCYKQLK